MGFLLYRNISGVNQLYLKNQIINKTPLTPQVDQMEIYAPAIASSAKPGQFIILRATEKGERIPLTIADTDKETGLVTIVYQKIGAGTMELGDLQQGECILDFAGPLGKPSELPEAGKVAVIGGGLGCAIAYPQAKALKQKGVSVDLIAGFRTKDIVFWEDRMKKVCENLTITTDDGSYGFNGFVTTALERNIKSGTKYDLVVAIGPVPMMKAVSMLTKQYEIPTIVSMNTIMIDGTGMCGGCRLTVGGKIKFACVDGPDFDGHLVDFDEVIRRNRNYAENEKAALKKREEHCRLMSQSGKNE